MVKVLVAKRSQGTFGGFWAEFEGEELDSYENDGVVFTLYKCTAYSADRYRVHVVDERKHTTPVYELYPDYRDPQGGGFGPMASEEPYDKVRLAETYPIFLKTLDYFETFEVR